MTRNVLRYSSVLAQQRRKAIFRQEPVSRLLVAGGKIVAVLTLSLVSPLAHTGAYVMLAAWALTGPRRAIEALTLTWLITFLNPGIFSLSGQSEFLRWLVIAAAFVSVSVVVFRRRSTIPRTLMWLWVFVGVAATLSLAVSYAPIVSVLKLMSFAMAGTAILLGFHLTSDQAAYWRTWFLTVTGTIVVLSAPLIAHDLGYVRNGRGFQGLLNHPQAYGVFLGATVGWLVFLILDGRIRGLWPWLLTAIASVSLVATESRTGALAALAAVGLTAAWQLAPRARLSPTGSRWLIRITPLLVLGAVVAFLNIGTVTEAVSDFVFKGGEQRPVAEAFEASRGDLLDRSLENFLENPLAGIGFGVASHPWLLNVQTDPFFGIPLGASIQKGFAIVAALEEVGLIGFIFLVALIGSLMAPLFRKGTAFAPLALGLGALFVNFGESIFFAVGGSGLLVWLLLGAARVMSCEIRP